VVKSRDYQLCVGRKIDYILRPILFVNALKISRTEHLHCASISCDLCILLLPGCYSLGWALASLNRIHLSEAPLRVSQQWLFTEWGCQPHAQPPAILEDQCFLLGLSPLAGWSQFESVRNSLFTLAWLSRKNVAQESRRGRACIGLGRNRCHYLSFDSTHPPARYVPSGPHTTPLTPCDLCILFQNARTQ
jgi:hypothetical protein